MRTPGIMPVFWQPINLPGILMRFWAWKYRKCRGASGQTNVIYEPQRATHTEAGPFFSYTIQGDGCRPRRYRPCFWKIKNKRERRAWRTQWHKIVNGCLWGRRLRASSHRCRAFRGRGGCDRSCTGKVFCRTVTTFSQDHFKRPGCGCYGPEPWCESWYEFI